jgi:hypothetical protein
MERQSLQRRISSIPISLILMAGVLAVEAVLVNGAESPETAPAAPPEKVFTGPGVRVSVKMIGPVTQTTDLQVICILKHRPQPGGDKYLEAMADLNGRLGGLLSSLRDRGEFVGDIGETLLFTPPPGSISPKRMLLVGVGEESALTLETLRLVGRIVAHEAARLGMSDVSFAPALRDQGSTRLDVGDEAAAVAGQFVLAFDTERRLRSQGLSAKLGLTAFTLEAGPKYFEAAAANVEKSLADASAQIAHRDAAPYIARP